MLNENKRIQLNKVDPLIFIKSQKKFIDRHELKSPENQLV